LCYAAAMIWTKTSFFQSAFCLLSLASKLAAADLSEAVSWLGGTVTVDRTSQAAQRQPRYSWVTDGDLARLTRFQESASRPFLHSCHGQQAGTSEGVAGCGYPWAWDLPSSLPTKGWFISKAGQCWNV
jgi:hypothetical protein